MFYLGGGAFFFSNKDRRYVQKMRTAASLHLLRPQDPCQDFNYFTRLFVFAFRAFFAPAEGGGVLVHRLEASLLQDNIAFFRSAARTKIKFRRCLRVIEGVQGGYAGASKSWEIQTFHVLCASPIGGNTTAVPFPDGFDEDRMMWKAQLLYIVRLEKKLRCLR